MSNEYQFTKDWFSWAPQVWEQLIPLLPERKAFLEIGSFEGRSTVWIIENMMEVGGFIDCIDTWEGGEEHSAEEMDSAEDRFVYNIDLALGGTEAELRVNHDTGFSHTRYASPAPTEGERKKVYMHKALSAQFLGRKLGDHLNRYSYENAPMYDFIYIDGSHTAPDVLTDACMAWPLLKRSSILVFDDYLWGPPRDVLHRPKLAIDAFVNIFAEQIDIIHSGYQFVVRKK